MIKDEKRWQLRRDTGERKWILIKEYMKNSIHGWFPVLSVINLLQSVCFLYPIKIETSYC